MKRRGKRRGRVIPVLFVCFVAGVAAGWWLHASIDSRARHQTIDVPTITATPSIDRSQSQSPIATSGNINPVEALRAHHLRLPIEGAKIEAMKGQFDQRRGGGARGHEAVDILAPRDTPVHAVEDGVIAKLFLSKAGGTTVYQFDPSGRFCYYYAHLQRYAEGFREGRHVTAGEIIGYVGTTGNASPNTPHLHFAVFELTPERKWWEGHPIDPYLVFTD